MKGQVVYIIRVWTVFVRLWTVNGLVWTVFTLFWTVKVDIWTVNEFDRHVPPSNSRSAGKNHNKKAFRTWKVTF